MYIDSCMNSKAHNTAQSTLQDNEELTFTSEEIDLLFPKKLRDNQKEDNASSQEDNKYV